MIDRTTRFWVAGIISGFALIAALGFVILGPGRFHPSPPGLRDNPDSSIPGRIAYLDRDRCVHVADASGASDREVICPAQYVDFVAFLDAETLVTMAYRGGPNPTWTGIDIETGTQTELGTHPAPIFPPFDGTLDGRVRIDDNGDVLAIDEGGATRVIYEASYPEYYRPQPLALSPDGEWVLLQYSGPRSDGLELWLVALDGHAAGTLTKDATWGQVLASWWIDGLGATPEIDLPDAPAQ